jgi:hypothetical protein
VKAESDDQEALRYLDSRGFTHPEMIERFQIGSANRTLGYRLPDGNRKEGAELRGRLQRLGIIRESWHKHYPSRRRGVYVHPQLKQWMICGQFCQSRSYAKLSGTKRSLSSPIPTSWTTSWRSSGRQAASEQQVAVPGVELFEIQKAGLGVRDYSGYEFDSGCPWYDFVQANNDEALRFMNDHCSGRERRCSLTSTSQREFERLRECDSP